MCPTPVLTERGYPVQLVRRLSQGLSRSPSAALSWLAHASPDGTLSVSYRYADRLGGREVGRPIPSGVSLCRLSREDRAALLGGAWELSPPSTPRKAFGLDCQSAQFVAALWALDPQQRGKFPAVLEYCTRGASLRQELARSQEFSPVLTKRTEWPSASDKKELLNSRIGGATSKATT